MAIICISQYTFHEFCATMLPRLVLGFTASSSPRRFPSYLVLASSFLPHASPCPWRVSRNTAPRTPRALRWNIVKTFRWWCLGFNWISRKISRKRRISEGENWRRGEISSYPPSTSTHSAVRAVYAVRCFVTSLLLLPRLWATRPCADTLKAITQEQWHDKPSMVTICLRSSSWKCTGTAKLGSASVNSYRAYTDGWTLSKRWISCLIANDTSSTGYLWHIAFIITPPSPRQLYTTLYCTWRNKTKFIRKWYDQNTHAFIHTQVTTSAAASTCTRREYSYAVQSRFAETHFVESWKGT